MSPERNGWSISKMRKSNGRRLVFLAVVAGLYFLNPGWVAAKELEDKKWLEINTANFQIRSMMSKRKTLKVARDMEVFRGIAGFITNTTNDRSPVPTVIYAIDGKAASEAFGLGENLGRFYGRVSKNTLVFKERGKNGTLSTALHEYVHFLMSNFSRYEVPMWFAEGYAEYLSSIRIRSDEAVVGAVPEEWVYSLSYGDWVPFRTIVTRKRENVWTKEETWMFYAQSWALVHYLQERPDRTETFDVQLSSYLVQLDKGIEPVTAFESAFAVSTDQIDDTVRAYLDKRLRAYVLDVADFEPELNVDVRRMSRAEVSLALGEHSYMIGEIDKAEYWFRIAAEKEETRALAATGLGQVQLSRGNNADALVQFEEAVALAPYDPFCQLGIAHYWQHLARRTNESTDKAVYFARARKHYTTAWQINPSLPEIFLGYGSTYLASEPDRAIDMLEQARRILPSNLEIRLSLAAAYANAGRKNDAAILARSVIAWSHSEWSGLETAREILDYTDTVAEQPEEESRVNE